MSGDNLTIRLFFIAMAVSFIITIVTLHGWKNRLLDLILYILIALSLVCSVFWSQIEKIFPQSITATIVNGAVKNPLFYVIWALGLALMLMLLRSRSSPEAMINKILLDNYPPDYLGDIKRAENEMWITGNSLRRMVPDHIKPLKELIERKQINLYVILIDNDKKELFKCAAQQDFGVKADIANYSGFYDEAIKAFKEVKEIAPKRVHIYKIKYPLPFGIDAIDTNDPNGGGVIYVRFYPFFGEGDRPILVLRPFQKKWFEFYKRQLIIQRDQYAEEIHD